MNDIQSLHKVILPFRFNIDPMEKLLVANFKGDPEFEGIEPQVFDDEKYGKGMRVLRYRKDGSVDVYWQKGVNVDKSSFSIGAGICDFMETVIEPATFEINDHGVDLQIAFEDLQGRLVKLNIQENAPDKVSFPLLAPVGADIANPLHFFLVYMSNFDFVRYKGTKIYGQIGDRVLQPASIPILLQGHRVWMIRYADMPIISSLNPPMDRPITLELPAPGSGVIDGMSVEVDDTGSIINISTENKLCKITFSPGFPNLGEMVDENSLTGRWSEKISGVPITGGTYDVAKRNGNISVVLDVTDHWKPANLPLSVNILTQILRMFRTWPATYRWQGNISFGESPSMNGKWQRVRR